MAEHAILFDMPPHQKSIIKVIGVGGGGSNAVNHMYVQGIKDVDFVVCNTDAQALHTSPVPNKLQIGLDLTSGLGAGANPEKGKNAAEESREEIRSILSDGTKMVFVTAGMGGGTGTGAAPVIAQIAQELGLLTVGIVTAPFYVEGRKKIRQAQEGIDELKKHCDTVLVILNDQLRKAFGNLKMREAFAQADSVLTTAARSIAEIITESGYVNVDFEDVKTVMKNAGAAVMGSAEASGEDRVLKAAREALNSPLLDNRSVEGAKKILFTIYMGEDTEITMDEFSQISDFIQDATGVEAEEVIFGGVFAPDLDEAVRVTIIATGFDTSDSGIGESEPPKDIKQVHHLEKPRQAKLFNDELNKDIAPKEISFKPSTKPGFSKPPKEEDENSFTPSKVPDFSSFTPNRGEDSFESGDIGAGDILDDDELIFDLPQMEREPQREEETNETPDEINFNATLVNKKKELIDEAQKRREALKGKKTTELYDQTFFEERWNEPAFRRKNVKLQKTPHSSERNVSRYNLNDDNQILGNNKFLHDNVD